MIYADLNNKQMLSMLWVKSCPFSVQLRPIQVLTSCLKGHGTLIFMINADLNQNPKRLLALIMPFLRSSASHSCPCLQNEKAIGR
jgi:hypothetical protein